MKLHALLDVFLDQYMGHSRVSLVTFSMAVDICDRCQNHSNLLLLLNLYTCNYESYFDNDMKNKMAVSCLT